ncbi:protein of unknown function [Pararobbsia alpina]
MVFAQRYCPPARRRLQDTSCAASAIFESHCVENQVIQIEFTLFAQQFPTISVWFEAITRTQNFFRPASGESCW